MAIYETEEEQLEALKKWWAENSSSVIGGVVTALVLVGGFNFWQSYQQDKMNQASALYGQLLESAAEGKKDSIEKIAQSLSEQYPGTAYAEYSELVLAKNKVQQGDLEGAKAVLEKEMKNGDSNELRHVARLRFVQLLLATGQYEQGLQRISEVHPSSSAGFSANYDELEGDLYVAMDRADEARNAYQRALTAGSASPLLKFKIDDLSAPNINAGAQ